VADDVKQHLSQISTAWTLVARAHETPGDVQAAAQRVLIERYQEAIYRYLLGASRNQDAADELFQEFALRFVRGDFRRANPEKGRFRDFVKTALINLVISHQRKRGKAPLQSPGAGDDVAAPPDSLDPDKDFLTYWRKVLLDRAWEGLAAAQKPGGPPLHTALRWRTEQPDMASAELAARLTEELKPAEPFTDAGIRKVVQRARELFTDLLVAEVARSLGKPTLDELEQEIIDLGFQAYCRKALERRRREGKA
jgi:RNA polymerase sigma-70 factor (ECF subfamily)